MKNLQSLTWQRLLDEDFAKANWGHLETHGEYLDPEKSYIFANADQFEKKILADAAQHIQNGLNTPHKYLQIADISSLTDFVQDIDKHMDNFLKDNDLTMIALPDDLDDLLKMRDNSGESIIIAEEESAKTKLGIDLDL